MEEIKVGEYIRTPYGTIEKVEKIETEINNIFRKVITENNGYTLEWLEYLGTIHSFDIKDLIGKGDYVNGLRIADNVDGVLFLSKASHQILNEPIQNIVTKEQFEQMKYIVGDESNEM